MKIKETIEVANNEGTNLFKKFFVVIVIQVLSVSNKTQRTNRANKKITVKFFCAAISFNHVINKFSRKLCAFFERMFNTAMIRKLTRCHKIYTGNTCTKPAR